MPATAVPLPTADPAPRPAWTPAAFHRPAGDRVRCTLCPHACTLAAGEVGRCHVRRAAGGGMETATFAAAVSHLDPIERKPFYHYRPNLPTLTLAAPGCSFACTYCLNYRLSQYGRVPAAGWSAAAVDPTAVGVAAAAAGAAVALSYSEPTLAPELTLALAVARPPGVDLVWKTNGFITPEALAVVGPHLAAVNVDLKAPDDRRHRRLTGGAGLADVLTGLAGFARYGAWVEVSTPVVPGFNAAPADVRQAADLILAAVGPDAPWHLLRFVPEFRFRGTPPTPPDVLAAAADAARAAGIRYVYVEKALGPGGRATRCPGCGAVVVARDPGAPTTVRLRAGRCPDCATPVPGRWEEPTR